MTTTPTPAARVSGTIKALYERACEVVHHDHDCPAIGGNGDADCKCDAVPFLNDFEALAAIQPDPEPVTSEIPMLSPKEPQPVETQAEFDRIITDPLGMLSAILPDEPATPSSTDALNIGSTYSHSPSSAGTVSVEALSKMIDSLAPTVASHAQMQAALRALAGEGGR